MVSDYNIKHTDSSLQPCMIKIVHDYMSSNYSGPITCDVSSRGGFEMLTAGAFLTSAKICEFWQKLLFQISFINDKTSLISLRTSAETTIQC